MENSRQKFAQRLRTALEHAGYAPRPAVLEREFNLRYWGKPVTLHGVRRWLRGEALPTEDKLRVLAEWLQIEPGRLRFGEQGTTVSTQTLPPSNIPHQEQQAIQAFLQLPDAQRRLVQQMIMICAQANAANPE